MDHFFTLKKKLLLMYILPYFHPTIQLKYIQQFTKNGRIKITHTPFAKQLFDLLTKVL
jgi:hypothetical protein